MDETYILAAKLKQAWRDLGTEVQKNRKFKTELFETTFAQTYSLLAEHAAEGFLDKKYIELVAEAFSFASIKMETLDPMCMAAFVLTERMLAYYAFGNAPVSAAPTTIYIAEARRDFLLDFDDVSESVNRLSRIFEELFWKKVNS